MKTKNKNFVVILVLVVIALCFAIYKIFDNSQKAKERAFAISQLSNLNVNVNEADISDYKFLHNDTKGFLGDGSIVIEYKLKSDLNDPFKKEANPKNVSGEGVEVSRKVNLSEQEIKTYVKEYEDSDLIDKNIKDALDSTNFLNSSSVYLVETHRDKSTQNYVSLVSYDKEAQKIIVFINRI